MRFKVGCSLRDLKPETICGLMDVDEVYGEHDAEAVITSVNDSKHMRRSKHYEGRAFDVRIRDLEPGVAESIAASLRRRLAHVGFDVVLERDHLHVEYHPK